MKLGIVGLPNIGKTTLFNAMTGRKAETSSYAMAATVTNLGSAEVPDERLNWLYDLYKPKSHHHNRLCRQPELRKRQWRRHDKQPPCANKIVMLCRAGSLF